MKLACHFIIEITAGEAIKYEYYDIEMPRCNVCGSEMEVV